ncbi:fructosamine-3-kinase-like isoform X2 [Tubulanus polymorphus]|uniref:fructosamine-3-kinase-like isoform X2 n=1 Tax=Tubulanus polymorphus TaxID=672921 RepID=UPI003DA38824
MENIDELTKHLRSTLGNEDLVYIRPVTGGYINEAALYGDREVPGTEASKKLFVKYNTRKEVLDYPVDSDDGARRDGGVIVGEYLENLRPVGESDDWRKCGEKIAKLHADNLHKLEKWRLNEESSIHAENRRCRPVEKFGFHCRSYFGHFGTEPMWSDSWTEYLSRFCLEPLFRYAINEFRDREIAELWSELRLKLHTFFDDDVICPSLLHGDCCSANIGIIPENGEIVTYDAQSRYGHHELDFVANLVERKFPDSFFSGYFEVLPITDASSVAAADHERRRLLYRMFGYFLYWTHGGGEEYREKTIRDLKTLL